MAHDLRPPAFVHVDLDGLWTLAGVYGFSEGESFEHDPIFEQALDRLLELFERFSVKATFFIVGRDLELEAKRNRISRIVEAGHELANHSWSHFVNLEERDAQEIEREISSTQSAIEKYFGVHAAGFRAPGYNAGPKVLAACCKAGIRYDGSLLPTPWAGLLRYAAGNLRKKVQAAQKEKSQDENIGKQYGQGVGPTEPFTQSLGGGEILRLPLAVSPTLMLPIHASLGSFLGANRVCGSLTRLARRRAPLTYLLHGMDVAAPDEFAPLIPGVLAESRAFKVSLEKKTLFLEAVLTRLKRQFEVMTTNMYLDSQ